MKYEKEKKQVGLEVQSLKEEDLKGVNGGGAITNNLEIIVVLAERIFRSMING